jgi:hypothetical protein
MFDDDDDDDDDCTLVGSSTPTDFALSDRRTSSVEASRLLAICL